MLGNSKLSSLLPSRGNAAKAFAQFNPSVQAQPALPEALSMRCAGDRFQVSRQFATVDSDGNAE